VNDTSRLLIVDPVLLTNFAPITGTRLPDLSPPKALSELVPVPKLYVSPPLPDPEPAVKVLLAFVPLSDKYHPDGNVEEVPEVASVLKSCVDEVPNAVNEIELVNVVAPALTELHALLPALFTALIR
jgi:hypothetical protein